MSSLPRSELAGILFQEIEGYLPEIENGIAVLRSTSADQETLNEVHRLFHNIKGAASQVSFAGLSKSAEFCEAVLADLLETSNPAEPPHLDFLSHVNDHIKEFCSLEEKPSEAEEELLAKTVCKFQQLMTTQTGEVPITVPETDALWPVVEHSETADTSATGVTAEAELEALRGECLRMLRPILPLLQELTGHSSRQAAGFMPSDILRKIISALSTLAYCSGTAGFGVQEKLIRNFLGILLSYQKNPEAADTSAVELVQEFLAYLDLIFSLPPEDGMQIITVVQRQLDRVLDSLVPRTEKSKVLYGEPYHIDPAAHCAPGDEPAPEADPFPLLGPDEGAPLGHAGFSDNEEAELLSIFLDECAEHLEAIATELTGLSTLSFEGPILPDDRQRATLNRMRVSAHTLKGAAAMTGFSHIAAFAYALEKLLRWLHEESRDLDRDDLSVIADGLTRLEDLADMLHGETWDGEEEESDFVDRHLLQRMQRQAETETLEFSDGATSPLPELDGQEPPDHLLRDTPLDDSGALDEQLDSGFFSAMQDIDPVDIIENLESDAVPDTSPASTRPEELSEEELELLEIFRTECSEHLLNINRELNSLTAQVRTECLLSAGLRETLARLRRGVHTLKGAASMTGFDQLAGCAHTLEDLLDWLHDHASTVSPDDTSLIAEAVDLIETHARAPRNAPDNHEETLARRIGERLQARTARNDIEPRVRTASPESEHMTNAVQDRPADNQAALAAESGNIRVKLHDLEELVNIEGELVVTRGSVEKLLDRFSRSLHELSTIKDALRRKSQELEVGFEAQSLYGFGPGAPLTVDDANPQRGGIISEFDPIELDRYSQLNLIIRSLNEISIDANAVHSEMMSLNSSLQGLIARQQLSMELMQEKLLRIRMTPLSAISSTFYRTVRQTAGRLGKEVELQLSGEDVMMDRFIWSKTMDPLMHMLRNCIDHGIEDRETRSVLKKPAAGRITIDAVQRGRMVILRVSDDGRGVDTARLRRKLIEENLIAADSSLSDEELLPYLFRPSVSTRDDINEISGRGVGLDVVFRNIQELRGKVKIINTPGRGVTFELSIPVTLSVNRAIIIALGERRFAVPIQDIVEVRRFQDDERIPGEKPQVLWNNRAISLHRLGPFLSLPATTAEHSGHILTFIIDNGEDHLALQIDRIEEQREVIVKDLGSHLRYVKGISGVTVTGEGTIIPILNLNELTAGGSAILARSTAPVVRDIPQHGPLRVLIVDDSISVRYSLSRLIESRSWQSLQAVDGVDALEKLAPFAPDVIILDIEMPRMNGYEFMAILRSSVEHSGLPVVMLTSRSSEKHRRKAQELGVNHYLTKPFQEDEFLELLSSMEARRYN